MSLAVGALTAWSMRLDNIAAKSGWFRRRSNSSAEDSVGIVCSEKSTPGTSIVLLNKRHDIGRIVSLRFQIGESPARKTIEFRSGRLARSL